MWRMARCSFSPPGRWCAPRGSPLQSKDVRKSGINPSLRWPDQNWELQYYYDHLPVGDAFDLESHRDRRKAILEEQLRKAIERIRDAIQTSKKAA